MFVAWFRFALGKLLKVKRMKFADFGGRNYINSGGCKGSVCCACIIYHFLLLI